MPPAHGYKARIYLNGYDLTGFYRSVESELTRETADATPFNVDDKIYLAGQRDASISLEGFFDGAADGVDEVLHAALDVDPTTIVVCPQGDALGNIAYGMESLETKFSIDAPKDDVVTLANELQSNVGRDRLLVHHTLSTETAGGEEDGLDHGAATAFGGVAYLMVPDLAGIDSLDVVIEDSADGSSWAALAAFAGVTGPRAVQRLAISGTVRRHTRAAWTFDGSGSAQFWVGFGRH